MVYRIISVLVIFFTFIACSLPNRQLRIVNDFSTISREFIKYPSDIFTSIYKFELNRNLFYLNGLNLTPAEHVFKIDSLVVNENKQVVMSEKLNISLEVVGHYMTMLYEIANRDTDKFYLKTKMIANSLNNYNKGVLGIGETPIRVSQFLVGLTGIIGKNLKKKQSLKYIQQFIKSSDVVIKMMLENIIVFLSSEEVTNYFKLEEKLLNENYCIFLAKNGHTISYDKSFITLKNEILRIRKKNKTAIKVLIQIKKTHTDLVKNISKKDNIYNQLPYLTELYNDFNNLSNTLD